jgi:bidirectional [NiFe] hydrogenase diaphorase subunit
VLRACQEQGIAIPTLCHLEGVSPTGACRVCLVEIRGFRQPVPACATEVAAGMEITTSSDSLERHRRAVVEMLFAGGNHVCAFCPSSGRCELQALACSLGLDHVTLGVERRAVPVDASHPRFGLDPGRCVLCTRCVRVCAEVERAGTLLVTGRGHRSRIATDGRVPWAASPTCTSCGRCVAACPTGALFEKMVAAQGLRGGLAAGTAQGGAPDAPPLPRGEPLRAAAARAAATAPAAGAAPGGARARLATIQLGGCSGCHASLLDGDEALLAVAVRTDLVYSPLADAKRFPDRVDVCLVEGAASTERDLRLLRVARERTRSLVAVGDCAGWGNVTAMRDAIGGPARVLPIAWGAARRDPALPALLDRVLPVPEVVAVDLHLAGCPPPRDLVLFAMSELLAGRTPRLAGASAFG